GRRRPSGRPGLSAAGRGRREQKPQAATQGGVSAMRIILLKDVPTLGRSGEVREVKDGYAQHYLLPRGLAAPATATNLQQLKQTHKTAQQREARILQQAADLKARLEALVVEVHAKAGEGGRLFGSVTAQDIADAITRKGIEISKKQVDL